MTHPDPDQEYAVKRALGISALRHLRHLVDKENAQQRNNTLWASRIGTAFIVVLALVLLVTLLRY